jgi:hypothetical protein
VDRLTNKNIKLISPSNTFFFLPVTQLIGNHQLSLSLSLSLSQSRPITDDCAVVLCFVCSSFAIPFAAEPTLFVPILLHSNQTVNLINLYFNFFYIIHLFSTHIDRI